VLVATHEVDTIVPVVDRVLALDRGAIVADGTPGDVFTDFGIARFAAIGVPVPLRWRAEAALHAAPSSAQPVLVADRTVTEVTRHPQTQRLPLPGVAAAMLTALLLALCFFLAAPLPWLALLAVAAPLVAMITGADLRRSARLFVPLALLATFATAGHVLTMGGNVRLHIGPVEITDPGLEAGARTWLRIIGPVLVGLAVSGGRPPVAVARELRRLLAAVPFARRLAAEAGLAVLLVVRLAPLMRGEVLRIERAQRARGGPAPARGLARVRSLMSLAVPAIVTTLLRAERLALALELRGWSGHVRARGPLVRAADLGWLAGASMIFAALFAAS
jgi:energy-coupling factor transport system permease protein